MEERIIDDEFGRGVRLKKTKDGYVDVTDELAEREDGEEYQEADEIAFQFPVLEQDEDDEELATLSPEEAVQLLRRREEEAAARLAEYEKTCAEGEELLQSGSFKSAELKFEKALGLDEIATRATVGYWRAKTANFSNPDNLIEEYAEDGIDELEHDLGIQAVDEIKATYKEVFAARITELEEEEKPLAEKVEEAKLRRREIITKRLKTSSLFAFIFAVPTVALLVLGIVFGLKNFTTRGDEFIIPTIVLFASFFVMLIACSFVTNKWLNDLRMRRQNERLSSTEEGKQLAKILAYKKLYKNLLPNEQN